VCKVCRFFIRIEHNYVLGRGNIIEYGVGSSHYQDEMHIGLFILAHCAHLFSNLFCLGSHTALLQARIDLG
jgi:hypothetical protein